MKEDIKLDEQTSSDDKSLTPENELKPQISFQLIRGKLKQVNPEIDENDDTIVESSLMDYINQLEEYNAKSKEAAGKLNDLFESEPELAGFMRDVLNGASAMEAIALNFDTNEFPKPGEPDYKTWETHKQHREYRLNEIKKKDAEFSQNVDNAIKTIEEFGKENNLTEEELNSFISMVDATMAEILNGKVSKEFLDKMYKALVFEEKIEEAKDEGKIEGRNENIEALTKEENIPAFQSTTIPEEPVQKVPGMVSRLQKKLDNRNY